MPEHFEPVLACCDQPEVEETPTGYDCKACHSLLSDAQGKALLHWDRGDCDFVPVTLVGGTDTMGCRTCHLALCQVSDPNRETAMDCENLATATDGYCNDHRREARQMEALDREMQDMEGHDLIKRIEASIAADPSAHGVVVFMGDLRGLLALAKRGTQTD